ncbi:MAG TPA: peptide chain release factor N(5)-glutamine methyltransferase [Rhodothermales bacterium]|nr:peptide chain release factor N(5)-glutamine methyltransferase [Rhodothermales bacterium]
MLEINRNNNRKLLVSEVVRILESGGIEDARRNAEWMAEEVLGCSRLVLYADSNRSVTEEEVARIDDMLRRRLQREPLQYILGRADFFGLTLRVSGSVLIPRPETEQVVERALQLLQATSAPRVLDVGTGSGCIPFAIKHERPDAGVSACDVSLQALSVARQNASTLGLEVELFSADVLLDDFTDRVAGDLDLVISNPPYIPDSEAEQLSQEVYGFEPHLALFSGKDPLVFYRAIAHHANQLLKPGAYILFEVHMDYARAVHELLEGNGYSEVRTSNDLAGRPRIVEGRWAQ